MFLTAISTAAVMSGVLQLSPIAQPITLRVAQSMTVARYSQPCITVRVSRLVLDWLRCVGIAPAGEVTVSDGARLAESRCCDLGRP